MARVRIELPTALACVLGGLESFELEAGRLDAALDELATRHPRLATHLFDETGAFREHVLCFHNEENTRWRATLDQPLRDGDVIRFLQAVSGG